MKILSFDVGIKNLSFCLLEEDIIKDWGILNICTDDVCDHCSKDGKRCDKSVTFICGEFQVCSAHKKLKQYSDKKFKKISKKDNPMLDQGKCIVETLQKKEDFCNVDLVVIENQPALKNPTMKSIQMILYSYFLINGVTKDESSIEDIQMINARNKLKAYDGPVVPCDIKDKYKKTKFLGIQYCLSMIVESEQDDQWLNLFTTSKKKDDLADAYLQGIYVLKSKV
tara:strand:- start:146 stop:820 length:675 start_codon:yes stop_codon:yes gene_type:complete